MFTFEQKLTEIRRVLSSSIKAKKESLEKFQVEFEKNPCHALTWSTSTFSDAAIVEVYSYVYESVSNPDITKEDIARIYMNVLDRVTRGAMNPASSTSATSNLVETYRTAAYAEILDMFSHYRINESSTE